MRCWTRRRKTARPISSLRGSGYTLVRCPRRTPKDAPVPDLRPEEAREAKAVVEQVVRFVLDGLGRNLRPNPHPYSVHGSAWADSTAFDPKPPFASIDSNAGPCAIADSYAVPGRADPTASTNGHETVICSSISRVGGSMR